MSSPLIAYTGSLDQPYRHLVLLCQPHFTSKTISIAFYLNGTAYFEHLNEDKIRQRLQVLNNCRRTSFRRDELQSVILRLKDFLSTDGTKPTTNELHAKLLSSRLLSIEINQDDFKFKFRCDERSELFEQHYVRQLLVQIRELSERQSYLCDLLQHKNQLTQFDLKLFLSTPMPLIDDDENDDEDDDTLSSSTLGSLWKSAFSRRGGTEFLDICLLKKSYMKKLEEMSDDEEETETISLIINDLIDQIEYDENDDDLDLAQRIGKRSLTESTVSLENESQQLKRLRSNGFL
jgi:hypothetical protein